MMYIHAGICCIYNYIYIYTYIYVYIDADVFLVLTHTVILTFIVIFCLPTDTKKCMCSLETPPIVVLIGDLSMLRPTLVNICT